MLKEIIYAVNMKEYDDGDPNIFVVGIFMLTGNALILVVKMEFNHLNATMLIYHH